ncbi:MAG: butyrate kinase [Rikenellaceae bacterium]
MSYKILAINPGSTSTKAALFEDKEVLFDMTLRHSAEELSKFSHVIEQLDWRKELILKDLESRGFNVADLSAVVGRGGLVKPIEGGVYEVNDTLVDDTKHAVREHASNLGALIARSIADQIGVKSYIADPVVVDELEPVARVSGLPEIPRTSMFHALNSKAIAHAYAEDTQKEYESLNLIVVHMGGGVSVSIHKHGRIVDTTNALSGDGAFSPERAGRLEPMSLVDLCFSGKYNHEEMQKMVIGHGGLMALMETNSMLEVVNAALAEDDQAKLVFEAFCYNVAKDVGAMSTVVCGEVDAILITGGIAYNEHITKSIADRCKSIAPVVIYPGENELGSLAENVLNVLNGSKVAKIYQ